MDSVAITDSAAIPGHERAAVILSAGTRKVALTAHVACSVGWIGAVAAFLALAVVGLTSRDAHLARGAYLAMGVTAWQVIVPLAFASLVTGAVSSLGTSWGLFRYYWIVFKLLLTSLATAILMVHMRPIDVLSGAAAHSSNLPGALQGAQWLMVIASSLAVVALVVVTALSIHKPRGVTPWGARRAPRATRS